MFTFGFVFCWAFAMLYVFDFIHKEEGDEERTGNRVNYICSQASRSVRLIDGAGSLSSVQFAAIFFVL